MIMNIRTYTMLDQTVNLTISFRDEDPVTGNTSEWLTKNVMIRPGDRDVDDAGQVAFLTARYLMSWAHQHGVT